MAYGLLYYNEVESIQFEKLNRFEILERDYLGASSEIKMNATISMGDSGEGREVPIKKKTADISILSTKSMEFEHLFTSDDKKYQFKVIRAGSVVFIGFLETDSYGEPYAFYENYMVNFTARDNLGTLKDIDYLDGSGDKLTGLQKITEIINNTLFKTGYFINKNDLTTQRSSDMSELLVPFDQSYINNDGFWNHDDNEPISCLEVITRILTGFGAQIRQADGLWKIIEQARYFELPFINGDDILPRFLQSQLNLNITPNDTYWLDQSANLVLQPAWKSFLLEQNYNTAETIFKKFPSSDDDFAFYDTGLPDAPTYTLNDWTIVGFTWVRHYNGEGDTKINIDGSGLSKHVKTTTPISASTKNVKTVFNVEVRSSTTGSVEVAIDLINGNQILTDSGWIAYTTQTRQLKFTIQPNTPTELTVISDGVPNTGTLEIKLWEASGTGIFGVEYIDLLLNVVSDAKTKNISKTLLSVINENNNLIPDDFDLAIGQVPDEPNSQITYLGGLFTSAGVAQVDWKRPEDTTPKNLLQCVAEGYDLLNNKVSRQISGKVFWDWDFDTNLKDQGRTLMINSGTWDVVEDTLEAEFIEVFEYKTGGDFNDDFNDDFENNDTGDYKTNSTFTLTQKSE